MALHYLDGFPERFRKAVATATAPFARLGKHPRFRVETVPQGTNVVKLHVKGADAAKYQAAPRGRGVSVRAPQGESAFTLGVNETLNRRPAEEMARAVIEALPD